MRLIFAVLLASLVRAEAPRPAEPYRSLVELAQAAPPEIASDAILRVVESGKIKDRDVLRDLIEQAFHLGGLAKFPVRMRGKPDAVTDTRTGSLSRAYDLKLDAVSLETRAVRDMLEVDKVKALELFREIPPLALAPSACEDALVYEVSDFYRTLLGIANAAFDEKQRAKQEHIAFVLDYLGQVTSPAQLQPFAGALQKITLTPEQLEILSNRLRGMAAHIPQNPVCEPNSAKVDRYWQSEAAKRLLADGLKLRTSPEGRAYTELERATPEWQLRFTAFLSEMADWTSSDEKSEADYYHEKCTIFEGLVGLIAPGPEREKLLADYVTFINRSTLEQQNPVEWFMEADSMLSRLRGSDAEHGAAMELYQASGSPTLALQVALERTLGARPPAPPEN